MTTQAQKSLNQEPELLDIDVTSVTLKKESIRFETSSTFRNFINQLLRSKSEVLKKIATLINQREFVGEDGINFIDLDPENNAKVTYLDKDRYNKFKDTQIFTYKFLPTALQFKSTPIKREFFDSTPMVTGDTTEHEASVLYVKVTNPYFNCFTDFRESDSFQVTLDPEKYPSNANYSETFISLNDIVFKEENMPFLNSNLLVLQVDGHPRAILGRSEDSIVFEADQNLVVHMASFDRVCTDVKVKLFGEAKGRLWDPKIRYGSTLGKLVNKMFPGEFTSKELELIANEIKSFALINVPGYSLEIVNGDSIVELYKEKHTISSGSLGGSCMRYDRCTPMLKFYEDFPDLIKLAVLRKESERNRIVARCLVWEFGGETYYDRIYSSNTEAELILKNYFKSYKSVYYSSTERVDLYIPIDKEYMLSRKLMPYMDSFYLYNIDEGVLTNNTSWENTNKGSYLKMRSQHGEIRRVERPVCQVCNVHNDEELISAYNGSDYVSAHRECVTEDVNRGRYIFNHLAFRFDFGRRGSRDVIGVQVDSVILCDGRIAHEDLAFFHYNDGRGLGLSSPKFINEYPHIIVASRYYHPDDTFFDDKEELVRKHPCHIYRTRPFNTVVPVVPKKRGRKPKEKLTEQVIEQTEENVIFNSVLEEAGAIYPGSIATSSTLIASSPYVSYADFITDIGSFGEDQEEEEDLPELPF